MLGYPIEAFRAVRMVLWAFLTESHVQFAHFLYASSTSRQGLLCQVFVLS